MKKLSRKTARFVIVCLAIFAALMGLAALTQNMVFFMAGLVTGVLGLMIRSSKIRCPHCGELKMIKMMDILKWSEEIHFECPTCGGIIEYDDK